MALRNDVWDVMAYKAINVLKNEFKQIQIVEFLVFTSNLHSLKK